MNVLRNCNHVSCPIFLAELFKDPLQSNSVFTDDLQGVFTFGLAFFLLLGEGRLIEFFTGLKERDAAPDENAGNASA